MANDGGWLFLRKPEYIAARLGAESAGQVGLEFVAKRFADLWRQNLSRPGLGTLYRVKFRTYNGPGGRYIAPSGPRGAHQASLPGMPPAKDTGTGADSIEITKVVYTKNEHRHRVIVGTDEAYLAFLEFGVGPGYPFASPTQGAKSSPAKSNVGISASAAGAKGNLVTIAPRPHFRPVFAVAFRGINQDLVAQMSGELAFPQGQGPSLKAVRRLLLRYAAQLGSLQAIGISTKLTKAIRNQGYTLERSIGNVDALLTSPEAVSRRVRNIIVGRQVGGVYNQLIGTGGSLFTKQVRRQSRVLLGRFAAPLFRF